MQVDDDTYDGTGPELTMTLDGFVGGIGESTVTYEAGPDSTVYMCMTVSWTGNDGPHSENVDFVTTPGVQCGWEVGWTELVNGSTFIPPLPGTIG